MRSKRRRSVIRSSLGRVDARGLLPAHPVHTDPLREENEMRTKMRLLVLVAVAAALGIASIASAGGETDKRHKEVLELTATTVQDADLDLGEEGFGVGDRFTFTDDVFEGDRKVGINGGECIAVRILPDPLPSGQEPESVTFNCVVSFELERGQLTIQGLFTFSAETAGEPFTLAVTGGTGAYRTAHGEAEVTETSETDVSIRVKLIL
jgi:allene oxide cyclase-like protein